jgi:mannose-6-phosphate isomerase-like protein (cupin superfamily)
MPMPESNALADTAGRPGALPGLPGAVAVSRLRVYDWPADDSNGGDGLVGGSPHLHTASSEGYVVVAGRGSVQTISAQGFAQTPLQLGVVLWFTPGTVHRLINEDGNLEIVTLMQNAGLPEAGDAVLTFPADVLSDPQAYRAAAALPSTVGMTAEAAQSALADAARARRDLAVRGWGQLREGIDRDPDGTLRQLYSAAARLVGDRVEDWLILWSDGPLAQATQTGLQLDALQAGRADHLTDSAVYRAEAEPDVRFGMCGRLTVWNLSGSRGA